MYVPTATTFVVKKLLPRGDVTAWGVGVEVGVSGLTETE